MSPFALDDFSLPLLFLALLCLGLLLTQLIAFALPTSALPPIKQKRPPRPLKPRTPNDCPHCLLPTIPPTRLFIGPIKPWSLVKSKRGRRKTISTEGYACDNLHCLYYGITNAAVHALVANGHHGINLDIQEFRCQSCRHKFSARRHTVLSHLKSSPTAIALVLAAMAEGLSVAAAVRVFGFAESTITTWLTRAGMHSERLHQQTFRSLHLPHVQLDELRTSLRHKGHEVWLWLALDAKTKLIAAAHRAPRTGDVGTSQLVHRANCSSTPRWLRVVARLLPFRQTARIPSSGTRNAKASSRYASATTLSIANTGSSSGSHGSSLDGR